jgi:hypothetical protein
MSRTALDLEGKDNASRAFQSATDHLKELRTQIDKMKGGQIDLGAKDAVKNVNAIAALERQYTSFEKKLQIATGAGAQATGMLDKLGLSGMTAGKALGMLGVIAGPALFVGIAQGAANAVIGLDAMREESEQISARFVAQAGSTRSAADALSAMNAIVGTALTNDEKMAASGQLMALGLAQSSTEAANLANIATNLGDKTQGAAQRIEGLTQVMVSGRLVGLKQYGISMQEVNALAADMQRETAGLTDIQAKQNAILQIGTQKLNEYTAAGGSAITKTQALQKAWEDYQDSLANNVNLGNVKNFITEGITAARIELQIDSADPLEQLSGLEAKLRGIQQIRDDFKGNPIGLFFAGGGGFGAQAEVDALIAKIAELKAQLGEESRWAAGANRLTDAVSAADVATQNLNEELQALRDKDAGLREKAALMAIYTAQTNNATASTLGLGAAMFGLPQSGWTPIDNGLDPSGVGRGQDTGAERMAAQAIVDETLRQNAISIQAAEDLASVNERAAKATQSAWESTFSAIASAAESEFSAAQSQLKGLLPSLGGGGGLGSNKPGSNGPFEDIFRAADVANLGGASPWAAQIAAQLGVSNEEVQAKARAAVEAFAAGFRTPEVRKLIDEAMLVDQVKQAEAAKTSLDSWGKEIAKAAGVNPNLKSGGAAVFDASFGADKKTGKNAAAEAAAQNASTLMVDALGSKLKDEAGRAIGFGSTLFGNFQDGFVDAAKKSDTLRRAMDEMALAAIGRAVAGAPPPSGGVGKTSKAGGAKL